MNIKKEFKDNIVKAKVHAERPVDVFAPIPNPLKPCECGGVRWWKTIVGDHLKCCICNPAAFPHLIKEIVVVEKS